MSAGPSQGAVDKLLGNAGFERPPDSGPVTRYQAGERLGAWKVVAGNVDHVRSSMWQPAKGSFSLELNGDQDGAISQRVQVIAGRKYHLEFSLAGDPTGGPHQKTLQVGWDGFPVASPIFDTSGLTPKDMGWICRSYTVTAAGSVGTLSFDSLMGGGSFGPVIDSVRMQIGGPSVTRAIPRKLGQGATNQQVAIFGTGIAQDSTVAFSGVGITVLGVNPIPPSEIVATVAVDPTAPPGVRDITLTNSNGQSDTCPSLFTVDPSPQVTSLTPDSGARGSTGLDVSIAGSDFQPGAKVVFFGGGITVTSVDFVDDKHLMATIDIDAHASRGARNVKVANPDRGFGICTACFTVT